MLVVCCHVGPLEGPLCNHRANSLKHAPDFVRCTSLHFAAYNNLCGAPAGCFQRLQLSLGFHRAPVVAIMVAMQISYVFVRFQLLRSPLWLQEAPAIMYIYITNV